MDDVEKRLRETADACISSYSAWKANQKNGEIRETLMEAIHELRKVASRLEIELAINERNEMAQKPIPIPPHRDARQRGQGQEGEAQDFNEDNFNQGQNYQQRGPRPPNQHGGGGGHRRRLGRRSEGGGHGGGGSGGME